VAVALALFVAVGCGEEPGGTTTTELNDKRAALAAKVAERKGKGAAAAPAARTVAQTRAAKPGAPGGVPGGFGMVELDYVYDPTGKRDPFRNFKWERPDRLRDRDLLVGPLEQFDLSQLSLIAVVWKTGNARALIQDPSGGSYIVAEGARIGKNEGFVTTIDDNLVMVKETYVDFLGRETTKDIELRMRGNEGG
jgi:type IV pilus assembly protein PilP